MKQLRTVLKQWISQQIAQHRCSLRSASFARVSSSLGGGTNTMNKNLLILFLLSVIMNFLNAQVALNTKSGSLYIGPAIIDSQSFKMPIPPCIDGTYSIQIDNQKIYVARKDSSILITNIELNKTHLVKIRRDNKIVESFRFSFEKEQSTELCLWMNDFYCTWSLGPLKDAKHLCKCRPPANQQLKLTK
jgi:hypothetical protein